MGGTFWAVLTKPRGDLQLVKDCLQDALAKGQVGPDYLQVGMSVLTEAPVNCAFLTGKPDALSSAWQSMLGWTHLVFTQENEMKLGAFSVSLNVSDIAASQAFYSKLGFVAFGGDPAQGWVMMRNGETVIGLFYGMLVANTLTFNPGWDQKAENLDEFEDIRTLQKNLVEAGLDFEMKADEDTSGPASFVILDPDGNPILVDQHR